MRTLIISLAAAAAIAASAAPAFAQPPDPRHARAHIAAIVGHPQPGGRRHRPVRDPPGSCRVRARPAGLAVRAAEPMLTMVLPRIVLAVAPQTTDTAPGLSQAKR